MGFADKACTANQADGYLKDLSVPGDLCAEKLVEGGHAYFS